MRLLKPRRREPVTHPTIDFSRLTIEEALGQLAGIQEDEYFRQQARRLIYNKAARPQLISDQLSLVRSLMKDARLTLADRCFATIAACHKAMEAGDERSVSELLASIS